MAMLPHRCGQGWRGGGTPRRPARQAPDSANIAEPRLIVNKTIDRPSAAFETATGGGRPDYMAEISAM
jgi:hypothetical protein